MKIILFFVATLLALSGSAQTTYTFNGNGFWTIPTNWSNNAVPPTTLPAGSTIIISPVAGGNCTLNISQTIAVGASIIISAGANFIIQGNVVLDNNNTTVTVCNQVWTTKNLEVTTYQNGDLIPQVTDPAEWAALTTGAWCYYENNADTGTVYGKLYNWFAVNDPRGLAPVGWHIPTVPEWRELATCLGGELVAGGPMKEAGLAHWNDPNTNATNASGLTCLPGGERDSSGINFYSKGYNGFWWSADVSDPGYAWYLYLYSYSDAAGIAGTYFNLKTGMAVRCIQNSVPVLTTVPISVNNANTITGGIISSDGGSPVIEKGVVWSTSPNPTIALSTKTNDGTGVAFYNSYISGLQLSATYYVRSYATSSLGTGYGNEVSFVNVVDDSDITICSQNWMRKNLEVTTYRNGEPIPQVTDPSQWANLTTGAWCYYNNDPATASVYGKLYNWYAANDPRGLAPAGWHIPTYVEFTTLQDCIGGFSDAGGAMKEIGNAHWYSPNTGATNSSGFLALPGGRRYDDGVFYEITYHDYSWTNTEYDLMNAWYLNLHYNDTHMDRPVANKVDGMAVRCLRD